MARRVQKTHYRGEPTPEAYFEHVMSEGVSSPGGCLVWPYGKNKGGYGVVRPPHLKKSQLLTRFIVEVGLGITLSEKEYVLHSCDNPACFNKEHLEVGDQKKNMGDAVSRGRMNHEVHHKLSDADKHGLLEDSQTGMFTQSMLGELYGINRHTVSTILRSVSTTKEV